MLSNGITYHKCDNIFQPIPNSFHRLSYTKEDTLRGKSIQILGKYFHTPGSDLRQCFHHIPITHAAYRGQHLVLCQETPLSLRNLHRIVLHSPLILTSTYRRPDTTKLFFLGQHQMASNPTNPIPNQSCHLEHSQSVLVRASFATY